MQKPGDGKGSEQRVQRRADCSGQGPEGLWILFQVQPILLLLPLKNKQKQKQNPYQGKQT